MRVKWSLCVLAAVATVTPPVLAEESWRLGSQVVPVSQVIELTLDPAVEDYEGSVRIDLEVREAVTTFRFHAKDLSLEGWHLTGPDGEIEVDLDQGDNGFVTASLGAPLKPDTYTLEIDFRQRFNTKGEAIYRTVADGVPYLFSQFQAIYARQAFPCWDEPEYKIPFRVRMRVPEGLVAVANTPIESESTVDGWREIQFVETKPLPTYLLAVAVGALEEVPLEGLSVPGSVYTVKGQAHLAQATVAVTPPILDAMAEYFGRPYPYAKLDLLAVPEFIYGAMENAGAVTFRDELLLLDPETAGAAEHGNLVSIMAHELAHMWFGDLVTMVWWDDLWLNESFASFAGDKIAQELYPEYRFELGQRRSANWVMSRDALPSTVAIRHEVNSVSDIFEDLGLAYSKGQAVLGMVEDWLGSEVFRRGVVEFLNRYAWKNAAASDFWQVLGKVAEVDVETVLSSYLDQPGLPLLDGEVSDSGKLTLRQSRLLNVGFEGTDQLWTVPVALRYSSNGELDSKSVLLQGSRMDLDLGAPVSWLTLDSGGLGYYRWRLAKGQMSALADNAVEVLSAPERTALLGNVEALLDAGSVTGAEYLDLLTAFGRDPEAGVVRAVLSGLAGVETAFKTSELEPLFAAYIRSALTPAVERFGLTRKEGEEESVSLLRPQLVGWLGVTGQDEDVLVESQKLAKTYMSNPGGVDPSLAAVSLRVAALSGDRALFDAFLSKFEATTVPQEKENYLLALGNFRDPALQKAALDLTLTDKVPTSDFFTPVSRVIQTEAGAALTMEWIRNRYGDLASRLAEENLAYLPYVAQGCSEEVLQEATKFFSQPDHQVEGTTVNLSKVTDATKDCLNLRRREGASVAEYLSRFAAD